MDYIPDFENAYFTSNFPEELKKQLIEAQHNAEARHKNQKEMDTKKTYSQQNHPEDFENCPLEDMYSPEELEELAKGYDAIMNKICEESADNGN